MIKGKISDLELSKDDISKQKITSILDNFESGDRIYYQGDEPIVDIDSYMVYEDPYPKPIDISGIDIDTLTDEQLLKLKERLGL